MYTTFTMVTDIERWEREGREDILERLDDLGRMWVHPKTKKPVIGDCPFLYKDASGQYVCGIQDTKPNICANFQPTEEQAKNMGCKGYEDEL